MRYHQFSVLFVLAAGSLTNFARSLALLWDDIRDKHAWNSVPPNWETLGPPPAGITIDLHFALKAHHENGLIDALYEVSDPKSTKYGAHLSKEQVAQLVAPHKDTVELINSWLEHHDVPLSSISTTHDGSWLTLTGVPVSQANVLLGASYQLYRHTRTNGTTILRTTSYALPEVLHRHVRAVVPTTYFASIHTLQQTPATVDMASRELVTMLSSRNNKITPDDLRSLYKTFLYVPVATKQNKLGVAGFLNHYPSPVDLKAFMTKNRIDADRAAFSIEPVNGGVYDPAYANPAPEANMNMQYTQVMAYPTPHTFYVTGGNVVIEGNRPGKGDIWMEWTNYLLNEEHVPQTVCNTYADYERNLPLEYATVLCEQFARLGARGATVIVASGNKGVGRDCVVNDGSGRVQFVPEFPASCPFVTSVGGTTRQDPEIAAGLSGGGFSNHFPREKYQDDAVLPFLQKLGNQYDGLYNAAGRGIPDVSAQALRISFIQQNVPFLMDGTSCAAPIVAGIISLLNDFLLSTNKRPLGFLNPWLYSKGRGGLNDIVKGFNPGCGTDGFEATIGWDPVTGLGTPDFINLRNALLGWP